MRKDKEFSNFRFKLQALTLIVIFIVLAVSFFSYNLGSRMVLKYAPLIDATMEIKLEATTAILLFEEIMSGEGKEDINAVYKNINNSIWYAEAMIHGGKNEEGTFIPLKNKDLITEITSVLEKLIQFKNIVEIQYASINDSKVGSEYDKRYDVIFRDFIEGADIVETKLQKTISSELENYQLLNYIIALCSIVFILLISYFILYYQKKLIQSFRLLIEFNNKLKYAEQKALKAISSQKAILAAIPDLMFEVSLDGKYIDIWASNPQELAATKKELLGHTVREKLPDEVAQKVMHAIEETNDKGSSFGQEIYLDTPNGSLWFELSVSIKNNENSPPTFIALSRNITDRKEMELKLVQLSNYDSLTNLYNRRVLEERLIQDIKRANRYKHSLSICMLDIDYFKNINDTYGHQEGDEVLIEISKLITSTLRDIDYCGRYGGEEFVIVLPNTSISKTKEFAERLRLKVQNKVFISDDKENFNITISIGISEISEKNNSLENLIKLADLAMYQAKDRGRNCIVTNSDSNPAVVKV